MVFELNRPDASFLATLASDYAIVLSAEYADQMRRAGMTWVKRQWRFHPGQNPAEAAGMINDAHARGFNILLGIPLYTWVATQV